MTRVKVSLFWIWEHLLNRAQLFNAQLYRALGAVFDDRPLHDECIDCEGGHDAHHHGGHVENEQAEIDPREGRRDYFVRGSEN